MCWLIQNTARLILLHLFQKQSMPDTEDRDEVTLSNQMMPGNHTDGQINLFDPRFYWSRPVGGILISEEKQCAPLMSITD